MTQPRLNISPFDRTVWIVIVLVIGLIIGTIALGDRVGVTVERVSPLGEARSTSGIGVTFSESMNRDSVTERFTVTPEITGTFSWSADTVTFVPDHALPPGESYIVEIGRGAQSESGRELISTVQFSFTVRTPRVAYLYPADNAPQNIWAVDPARPDTAAQITFSPTGIYDFAVSPDGSQIAFSERATDGTSDIKLIDLDTGGLRQLTNCPDSACTTPVWRPDGRVIAYERVDFNSSLQVGRSPTRVWLIDLTTTPASTRPLFQESQLLSYNAQWSADGNRIAVFDSSSVAILVYDFTTGEITAVPSRSGTSGALSPDGTKLVFPDVPPIEEGQNVSQYLRLVDLVSQELGYISTPDDPVEDDQARWSPDGEWLAITRRYTDDRYTRGYQLYLIDPDSPADAQPLTDDPSYADGVYYWDATGTQIVIQRLHLFDENGQPDNLARPEIWTLDIASGTLTRVAMNAYLPRWVP